MLPRKGGDVFAAIGAGDEDFADEIDLEASCASYGSDVADFFRQLRCVVLLYCVVLCCMWCCCVL